MTTTDEKRCLCEQQALDHIPPDVACAALWMCDGDRDRTRPPSELMCALLSAATLAQGLELLRFIDAYPEHAVAVHLLRDHPNGRDVLRAITERTTP